MRLVFHCNCFTTVATPQLSDVTGARMVTAASHNAESAVCVTFTGQVMLGSSTSFTTTVIKQVEVLPAKSVTVQVMSVDPCG
jgi:hypothetical protein